MEKSELRLGNLAQDQNGNLLKCVGITENGTDWYVVDRTKFPLEDGWSVHPIILTAEWLERFGFDSVGNSKQKHYQKDCVGVYLDNQGFKRDNRWHTPCDYDVKLDYVHELQNFYFVHRAVELTLND